MLQTACCAFLLALALPAKAARLLAGGKMAMRRRSAPMTDRQLGMLTALISGAWFVGALLGSATGAAAQVLFEEEGQKFDPALCSVDTGGKVLVRLTSGLAFWFEPYTFMLRGGLEKPADPTAEPEGCPANPIVTMSLSFPLQYTEALEAKRSGLQTGKPVVTELSIIGHDGPTRSQDSDIRKHAFYKGQGDDCRVSSEGVEICLTNCKPDSSNPGKCLSAAQNVRLKKDAGSKGLALPGAYAEFRGRRFAYGCLPRFVVSRTYESRSCHVGYEISEGLSVVYYFDSTELPEDSILLLDKMIRDQILAARAPQYDQKP